MQIWLCKSTTGKISENGPSEFRQEAEQEKNWIKAVRLSKNMKIKK